MLRSLEGKDSVDSGYVEEVDNHENGEQVRKGSMVHHPALDKNIVDEESASFIEQGPRYVQKFNSPFISQPFHGFSLEKIKRVSERNQYRKQKQMEQEIIEKKLQKAKDRETLKVNINILFNA